MAASSREAAPALLASRALCASCCNEGYHAGRRLSRAISLGLRDSPATTGNRPLRIAARRRPVFPDLRKVSALSYRKRRAEKRSAFRHPLSTPLACLRWQLIRPRRAAVEQVRGEDGSTGNRLAAIIRH